tara:strand:+ start:10115 stop:10312 length:198 start_codon:yes stop_codon:yes gene_type:complete
VEEGEVVCDGMDEVRISKDCSGMVSGKEIALPSGCFELTLSITSDKIKRQRLSFERSRQIDSGGQ